MPAQEDDRACTLQEVADELGITRQRVQQIERKALEKCRKALAIRGLSVAALVADDPPTTPYIYLDTSDADD